MANQQAMPCACCDADAETQKLFLRHNLDNLTRSCTFRWTLIPPGASHSMLVLLQQYLVNNAVYDFQALDEIHPHDRRALICNVLALSADAYDTFKSKSAKDNRPRSSIDEQSSLSAEDWAWEEILYKGRTIGVGFWNGVKSQQRIKDGVSNFSDTIGIPQTNDMNSNSPPRAQQSLEDQDHQIKATEEAIEVNSDRDDASRELKKIKQEIQFQGCALRKARSEMKKEKEEMDKVKNKINSAEALVKIICDKVEVVCKDTCQYWTHVEAGTDELIILALELKRLCSDPKMDQSVQDFQDVFDPGSKVKKEYEDH